jgi:lysophospholipase L1-like esterase
MKLRLLLLAAVSLVLSLAAVEVLLERAKPLWAVFYPPICFRPDLFRQTAWGYTLWPGTAKRHDYPPQNPRAITLHANAEGFRGRRDLHAPADGRTRIAVLGDSMVFGEGVEEEERFTERLEQAEPSWRVDNLGMVGFGTDLMVRAFEAEGLEPRPDAVVIAVFTDDLRRVVEPYAGVGFPLPRFRLEDGALRTVPYPSPGPLDGFRLVQGLRYAYWRYTDATFALNGAILDRFLALARERGIAPAIVFLSSPQDRADDQRRRRWLRAYAERAGVPFLDLTETVEAAGGQRLFLTGDPHWNADGHAAVAAALREFLRRDVLRKVPTDDGKLGGTRRTGPGVPAAAQ